MADLRALYLSHDRQHTQPQTIQLQYSFICSALSLFAMYLETSTRIATHHWPNSFATFMTDYLMYDGPGILLGSPISAVLGICLRSLILNH